MNARTFAVSIVAALLAVLTLATAAGAECAWVLWVNIVTPVSNVWETDTAFDNKKECDQNHGARLNAARRMGATILADMAIHPKLNTTHTYRCLPDTIDPRGVKGAR
jgi:hypothetical protein